ncbi:RNA methyltransferase [Thalassotalea sp. Y01]|uniref:RNA methyltransferase n=1 Tax=Thalassotalea sp. Y01 TaxID=2729613 RepID=UPI00145D2646|nr:RNA methyltransferase [Thalassotalea sp. Y01]NMP15835.1 RNA methyltransferase [Thalassotalea sp. Y01]
MTTGKVHIGLINPKSPTNVGSVMRASGNYQVNAVCYSGQRYSHAAKFHTDTKNITQKIPLTEVEHIIAGKPQEATMVCVDLVEGATPLPEYQHPDNAYYVFGPEDGTISQSVIDSADDVVYIPTIGCMNLAATVNVVLYDRLAKSANKIAGDELIRSSRDINNKVKVKSP